jgi:hypothetical protein
MRSATFADSLDSQLHMFSKWATNIWNFGQMFENWNSTDHLNQIVFGHLLSQLFHKGVD